jgi:hypothetical protein
MIMGLFPKIHVSSLSAGENHKLIPTAGEGSSAGM